MKETEQPVNKPSPGAERRVVGPERSGRLVVLVFVGSAALIIGAGWWFLRWAGDLSRESLVPGTATSASAPALPPTPPSASPSPPPAAPKAP